MTLIPKGYFDAARKALDEEKSMEHQFYDQGWNDRVAGKPLPAERTRSYQDGWRDCDGVDPEQRVPMDDLPAQRLLLTEAQIKHMVDRFLQWKLPENFSPDAGISFTPTGNTGTPHEYRHNPTGTNLLDSTQADAMVRFMIEGMPADTSEIDAAAADVVLKSAYCPQCGLKADTMLHRHCTNSPCVVREALKVRSEQQEVTAQHVVKCSCGAPLDSAAAYGAHCREFPDHFTQS